MKNQEKFHYIEIVEDQTEEVVKRIDVTNQSERNRERLERGMSINLNHNEFTIRVVESETELSTK